MSYLVIRKLLEVQFNSVSPTMPVAWENVPFAPAQGAAWQRVTLLPGPTQNPTWGDNFRRETGIFQVSLFYPEKSGPQPALSRALLVMAKFTRGLALSQANVRVLIDTHPFIGPGVSADGWYHVPVSIPFIADVF